MSQPAGGGGTGDGDGTGVGVGTGAGVGVGTGVLDEPPPPPPQDASSAPNKTTPDNRYDNAENFKVDPCMFFKWAGNCRRANDPKTGKIQ
jgi:hypothetical protein